MRVVYLSPSGQVGGAEASLLDIFASFGEAEPDWSCHLVASASGPLVSKAEALGVPTTVLPFPSALARLGDHGAGARGRGALLSGLASAAPGVLGYVNTLRGVLRDLAPDLVHSNGLKMHVLAAWAAPRRVPVIWHVREYISQRPAMSRLLRWNTPRCAAAVGISRTVVEDLQRVCGGGLRVHLVYNAVDTESFAPNGLAADLDELSGLPLATPGTVRVGLPATLATWKGQPVFLNALSMLPRTVPVRGYIIGGEVYEPEGSQSSLDQLRALARSLGLADRVGFTGFVQDSAPVMRALDVVVHASTRPEPFGRVIAEAMACGRAVIASEAGGAAEIISAGTDALGHPPGDAEALADRIEQLVMSPELRVQLGKAARATAQRRFDRSRLATELEPIYREVRCTAGRN